ncbi:MAG: hypothetical protein M1489_04830, partial [Firmicutes bacterium]|nr:hypothetical protein [Bacillota bacterium]
DEQFIRIDERFNQQDEQFIRIEERFNQQDEQFIRLQTAVMELLADSNEAKEFQKEVRAEFTKVNNRLDNIDGKLPYLIADVEILKEDTAQNKRDNKVIKKLIGA